MLEFEGWKITAKDGDAYDLFDKIAEAFAEKIDTDCICGYHSPLKFKKTKRHMSNDKKGYAFVKCAKCKREQLIQLDFESISLKALNGGKGFIEKDVNENAI